MKSILQMFKQGTGPHSTLNMTPYQACLDVAWYIHNRRIEVNHVQVHLYNEFARLEKQAGISSDIYSAFALANYKIAVTKTKQCPTGLRKEPYVMDIEVYTSPTDIISRHRVVALGGGSYKFIEGDINKQTHDLPFDTFEEVKQWFIKHPDRNYVDFVSMADNRFEFYATLIKGHNLAEIALRRGLTKFGEINLPDKDIHYLRRARSIWLHDRVFQSDAENSTRILTAFAYALAEEICNKAIVVSSPTLCTTSVL
ncbi:MAG: hypothetical protein MJ223_01685 [Mycoplasmoidaceae bacterium]|nr:hypothetical protein [Mycoplasmoidaceae bacterium]